MKARLRNERRRQSCTNNTRNRSTATHLPSSIPLPAQGAHVVQLFAKQVKSVATNGSDVVRKRQLRATKPTSQRWYFDGRCAPRTTAAITNENKTLVEPEWEWGASAVSVRSTTSHQTRGSPIGKWRQVCLHGLIVREGHIGDL